MRISLERKIDTIYPIMVKKSVDKSSGQWQNFKTINKIRNRLSHYSGGIKIYNDQDPYGVNIVNCEKGIQMVRFLVRELKQLIGQTPPHWIDQIHSKVIR
jgi:hypothetical protein